MADTTHQTEEANSRAQAKNERQSSRLFIAVAILSLLILGTSAASIATSKIAVDDFRPYFGRPGRNQREIWPEGTMPGTSLNQDGDGVQPTGWTFFLVPRRITYDNERAILGASIAVLILVLWPLFASVFGRTPLYPEAKRTTGFGYINTILTGGCFLSSPVAVIYIHVMRANRDQSLRTSGFETTPAPNNSLSTLGFSGDYDLEDWSCQIRQVMDWKPQEMEQMNKVCEYAMAARWLSVALLVLTALLFGLTFFVVRRQNEREQALKPEEKDLGRTPLARPECAEVEDGRTKKEEDMYD